jgi:hypothetical protein
VPGSPARPRPLINGLEPLINQENISQMDPSDHLFRREAGRMVATLARIFGVHNLALASLFVGATRFLSSHDHGIRLMARIDASSKW